MNGRPWTRKELFRLVDLYAVHSAPTVAAMLGRSLTQICSAIRRYGLAKSECHRPRLPWTRKDVEQLRELYPRERASDVARILGRERWAVHRKARKLGIRKSREFFEAEREKARQRAQTCPNLLSGRFAKGHVPANKGLRRPGWFAGRMKETQFKAGQVNGGAARRRRPVGTILADHEGYLRIKVRDRRPGDKPGWNPQIWPLLSHEIWRKHNGPIPPKHLVKFKDGNRANCDIQNLFLQSMADNARENQMWNCLPPDLAHAIALNAALKRKLRRANAKEE